MKHVILMALLVFVLVPAASAFFVPSNGGVLDGEGLFSSVGGVLLNQNVADGVSPSGVAVNNASTTLFNQSVNWSINIEDEVALSSYVFGHNGNGSWVNDSVVFIGGTSYFANATKNVNSTNNQQVCGTFWFNDSLNNRNASTSCYTTSIQQAGGGGGALGRVPEIVQLSAGETVDLVTSAFREYLYAWALETGGKLWPTRPLLGFVLAASVFLIFVVLIMEYIRVNHYRRLISPYGYIVSRKDAVVGWFKEPNFEKER